VPSQSCPLCQREYAEAVARCACGYGFETGDVGLAIARLAEQRRRDLRIRDMGLILVLALPLTIAFGYASETFVAHVLAIVAATVQAGVGGAQLIVGAAHAHRTGRQLRSIAAARQLPTARLIT
jgi:hypothetical protein